jgi:hypothetical protein
MELIDRYLQAVRFWLPDKQKHDIIAELSEDLQSQLQEKEDALGRQVNYEEQVQLLKRFGAPMEVAARYVPQQQPMRPAMFMIYRFVLKLVVVWVLLPLFSIVSAGPFFAAQNHPAALLATVFTYLRTAVFAVGMITIVFGLLSKYQPNLGLQGWDPRKLPKVRVPRDPMYIPRFGSATEVFWNLLFVLWWVDFFRLPIGYGQEGDAVRVTMVPVWHNYFWPILLVSGAALGLAAVNLMRPWWTRARAGVRLFIDSSAMVISLLLLRTGYYADVSGAGLSTAKAAEATHSMNLGLQICFAIMAVAFAIAVVVDLRRLLRTPRVHLAQQSV